MILESFYAIACIIAALRINRQRHNNQNNRVRMARALKTAYQQFAAKASK